MTYVEVLLIPLNFAKIIANDMYFQFAEQHLLL